MTNKVHDIFRQRKFILPDGFAGKLAMGQQFGGFAPAGFFFFSPKSRAAIHGENNVKSRAARKPQK